MAVLSPCRQNNIWTEKPFPPPAPFFGIKRIHKLNHFRILSVKIDVS
jgi:hypothetical protein